MSNHYHRNQIRTISGDTWDIIAKRIWGNEKLMSELVKKNPSHRYRVIFPAGVTLTVPNVETAIPQPAVPPWRR